MKTGSLLPDAIPLVANAGDVTIVNRHMLHGSFANTSPDPRVSITFGFYPHSSVLGVSGGLNITLDKDKSGEKIYDEEHIRRRSAVVQVAIDARHQARPEERRYRYAPFLGDEDDYRYGPGNDRERAERLHPLRHRPIGAISMKDIDLNDPASVENLTPIGLISVKWDRSNGVTLIERG